MSVFKKIKKKVKKTGKKAADTVMHAEKKVEHNVKGGADVLHKTAKDLEEIVSSINPIHLAEEIKKEVIDAINSVKDQAVKEVEKVAEEAIKEIRHELEVVANKLVGKTAEEVLEFLVDIIKAVNPSDVSIHLGPLTLDIGDVVDKVEKIEHYAKNPPHNRQTWKAFIQDVSPSSLSIVASVGFAFIIESDALELGVEATWTGEDIIKNVDNILAKAGV